ncbi:MAG TPA: DUF167 domain-containing protein [Solirubrobacteraceae bacterium]|nr:DUF167 domain-containing protein [Solirubrobacteraceae bacterium]
MEGTRIEVRLQSRASRDEVIGMRDGVLHVRVSAPPVAGEANRALCRLIARRLSIAPSRVDIVRGERSRLKVLAVSGVGADELAAAFA